jgi:hypothetical protein
VSTGTGRGVGTSQRPACDSLGMLQAGKVGRQAGRQRAPQDGQVALEGRKRGRRQTDRSQDLGPSCPKEALQIGQKEVWDGRTGA